MLFNKVKFMYNVLFEWPQSGILNIRHKKKKKEKLN